MTDSNRISHWREAAVEGVDRAKDKAAGLAQQSFGQTKVWLQRAGRFLGERPALSVAAALSLGVAMGWLIKRR